MNDHVEDTQNTHNKLVELEDCSRRNNIKIDRVKEDSKETLGRKRKEGSFDVERSVGPRKCGDRTCA